MMTSRCEYRLLLRQDNADLRLTEKARRTGLISPARYDRLQQKREAVARAMRALDAFVPPSQALTDCLSALGAQPPAAGGARLFDLLKRPGMTYTALLTAHGGHAAGAARARAGGARAGGGAGALRRLHRKAAAGGGSARGGLSGLLLPPELDYMAMDGLRLEARQKLSGHPARATWGRRRAHLGRVAGRRVGARSSSSSGGRVAHDGRTALHGKAPGVLPARSRPNRRSGSSGILRCSRSGTARAT